MPIRIYRSKTTTPTARTLANCLKDTACSNTKLLKTNNSVWKGKEKDLVINWGCSKPYTTEAVILNKPEAIKNSIYKLRTFKLLEEQGLNTPSVVTTSNKEEVVKFLVEETLKGVKVFLLRSTETGHSGKGIYVLDNVDSLLIDWLNSEGNNQTDSDDYSKFTAFFTYLVAYYHPFDEAKFITSYFKGVDEYRVHVMLGQVIFLQRKALRTDENRPENPSFIVRNHDNGFIFQHNNIEVPELVQNASVKAVKALGLDFGAVDIKYNQNDNTYCILEINSAPGLTGTTLEVYTEAFTNIYKAIQ